jgi:hypothetical protein
MRQEASRLGGIGSCGRELCCSTWLTDFKTVSTAAARYQNLSLNTLKLAGQCGKLKCCLNYELDTYMDALKDFPEDIKEIKTKRGSAYLQKSDIFKRMMWFSYRHDEAWIPLHVSRVNAIIAMNKNNEYPEDLSDVIIVPKLVEKVLDYENVVGQDSLTRMDERNRKKKSNNNNNRNKRNNNNRKPNNPNNTGGTEGAVNMSAPKNNEGGNPNNPNRPPQNNRPKK